MFCNFICNFTAQFEQGVKHATHNMKKTLTLCLMLIAFTGIKAQQSTDTSKVKLTPIQHLVLFGNHYPQEKVYLHTDNSCYFLGDTIWYKAYVTRSDNNHPSNLSKILYVELFSPDGFLVERQRISINTTGEGYGCFALTDSRYGGYYELRAD